ncbi:MAG: hypothetical protein WKF89_12010 [Chitinophagaceae bacterium]
MSHMNMEIMHLTKELMTEIHRLTLQISQLQVLGDVRPISDSVCSVSSLPANDKIRHYSYDFIKYLVSTHAAGHGINHLESLFEKGALTNENLCAALKIKLEMLRCVIKGFKQTAESGIEPN